MKSCKSFFIIILIVFIMSPVVDGQIPDFVKIELQPLNTSSFSTLLMQLLFVGSINSQMRSISTSCLFLELPKISPIYCGEFYG